MKKQFKEISGSIVAPIGFMASGVFCDIKKLGTGKGSNKGQKRDLALIVSETPATVAGMFTTNQVCAAPVKVCVERMKKGTAQVVVVNSGNANACTGKQGMADAREMVAFTEKTLALSAGRALVGFDLLRQVANDNRGLGKSSVAARMLGMKMRGRQVQNRTLCQLFDSPSNEFAVLRTKPRVDHEGRFIADDDADVGESLQHVDVIGNLSGFLRQHQIIGKLCEKGAARSEREQTNRRNIR